MTTPARQRVTEARIQRALAAWAKQGLPVAGLEVTLDGTVRILASAPASSQPAAGRGNSCDGKWGAKRGGER